MHNHYWKIRALPVISVYTAIDQSSFQSYTVDKYAVVIRLSNKDSITSMTHHEFDDFESTDLQKVKAFYAEIDCRYRVRKQ